MDNLTQAHRLLIAATDHALRRIPASTANFYKHMVVATALDSSNGIDTGMSLFPAGGGVCAELAALANSVIRGVLPGGSPTEGRIWVTTITIVTNERRILSPCGKCRQFLLEHYPNIEIVVSGADGLKAVGIQELMPYNGLTQDWV